jgi:hypothetical protein
MKRRALLAATGAAALTALTGCAGPQVSDYAAEKPVLDLRQYFNGTLDAWGVFTDRSGKVVKRFTVVMQCSWQGDDGVLDEDFTYSDGTKQRRIWRLKKLADGRYTGRADDVVGEATGQEALGNAFNWKYTLALPVDGRVIDVQFDDWMYLMTDKVMLNKAVMSKFGFTLGRSDACPSPRGHDEDRLHPRGAEPRPAASPATRLVPAAQSTPGPVAGPCCLAGRCLQRHWAGRCIGLACPGCPRICIGPQPERTAGLCPGASRRRRPATGQHRPERGPRRCASHPGAGAAGPGGVLRGLLSGDACHRV